MSNKKFRGNPASGNPVVPFGESENTTTLLVAIRFAKAPNFFRGASPITDHCGCRILFLEKLCRLVNTTNFITIKNCALKTRLNYILNRFHFQT
jgi:hypothetical protein